MFSFDAYRVNKKRRPVIEAASFRRVWVIPLRRSNFALQPLFAKNQTDVVACFGFCSTPGILNSKVVTWRTTEHRLYSPSVQITRSFNLLNSYMWPGHFIVVVGHRVALPDAVKISITSTQLVQLKRALSNSSHDKVNSLPLIRIFTDMIFSSHTLIWKTQRAPFNHRAIR